MSDVDRPAAADAKPVRNMADIARLFLDGARTSPDAPRPTRVGPNDRKAPLPPVNDPGRQTPDEDQTSSEVRPGGNLPSPPLKNATTLPTLQIALAPESADAWTLLYTAADMLAIEHDRPIALLGMFGEEFIVDLFQPNPEAPVLGLPDPTGVSIDVHLARTLFALRKEASHWIIALPPSVFGKRPQDDSSLVDPLAMIQQTVEDVLLVAATDKDSIISTYQLLKGVNRSVMIGPRRLRVFLATDDFAEAAAVHARLLSAVQNFLHLDLALAGVGTPLEEVQPLALLHAGSQKTAVWEAVLDLVNEVKQGHETAASPQITDAETALASVSAAVEQVSADVADASAIATATFDHLANVLDPEERAALNTGMEIDDQAVSPEEERANAKFQVSSSRESVTEMPLDAGSLNLEQSAETGFPVPDRVPCLTGRGPRQACFTMPSPGESAPPTKNAAPTPNEPAAEARAANSEPTLRAIDPPGDPKERDAQWQAIVRSVRDFIPDAVVLDASSPLEAESLLALDPAGRLHIFTLARDMVSWSALWQWGRDHRHLLALTRRESAFDPQAPVVMHIVLPLDFPLAQKISHPPLPELNWYRLRLIEWHARRGLILVPVG